MGMASTCHALLPKAPGNSSVQQRGPICRYSAPGHRVHERYSWAAVSTVMTTLHRVPGNSGEDPVRWNAAQKTKCNLRPYPPTEDCV